MTEEKLFDGPNAAYAQELYERYAHNPESVPEAWRTIFSQSTVAVQSGLLIPEALSVNGAGAQSVVATPPAAPAPAKADPPEAKAAPAPAPPSESAAVDAQAPPTIDDPRVRVLLAVVAKATAFVQAFRDHGHQLATVDPLGSPPPGHPQLDPAFFGTTMEEVSQIPASVLFDSDTDESLAGTLRRLQEAYCGSTGFQFEHLEDPEKARWLWNAVESGELTRPLSDHEKIELFERLAHVEGFEQFLHKAYLGAKRFSIEGTDMLVPMLDQAIREAAADGGREVIIGMAHRGRLNVLTHIVGVPYRDLLAEFEGAPIKNGALSSAVTQGTGDVKYHHGADGDYALQGGGSVHVRLMPNPSHLEFVNPVASGLARQRQFDGEGNHALQDTAAVVPIIIHGDAAFAAEGVVAETLNLARLRGYSTGGSVHIIANNQIGFTTIPNDGRSTRYSSDVAKGYDIPVIHVNADDPEACLAAVRVAMAYRHQYQDDVLIDLIGYRRHGHNEGDEPAYTQPALYSTIREHPTVGSLWGDRLVDQGTIDGERRAAITAGVADMLREAQDFVRTPDLSEAAKDATVESESDAGILDTAVPFERLSVLNGETLATPEGFQVHPKLLRQLQRRTQSFDPETRIDWAHGEALAFGSLLEEGVPVRMSGQDAQRGTFSHRHLVLHDAETGVEAIPLASVGAARFEVYNSPLSETAVLGFEYGYSVGAGRDLILWEAQFGDFVNVAQVVLDQFLSSGHSKWGQRSRLVLLLPHGYEGQGPEHSSARLERFLQLCAEDNMRVAYPTSPAQYFHLLRRQAHAKPERPLIVMTPKSLLRLPAAASPVSDLAQGRFQPVLDDPALAGPAEGVERLVLCTGKFFYDLSEHEDRAGAERVAVARVEELYPFPTTHLQDLISRYPNLREVIWAQEEPRNMGALSFVGPRLRVIVPRTVPLRHVSRPERASPAEGNASAHADEQNRLAKDAITIQ